jgi:hypothetical protein
MPATKNKTARSSKPGAKTKAIDEDLGMPIVEQCAQVCRADGTAFCYGSRPAKRRRDEH